MTSATQQQTARHIDLAGPAFVVRVSDGTANLKPRLALSVLEAYRLVPPSDRSGELA
ncbi:hypothetical protein C8K30_11539 [Promicromonospora sp. AC04]|uniref:hypothetical protein n=1 Tax=Promicromonospora sp. AC04 TaxID=2135723 RepID=UPI000D40E3DD|nr:hypothetical protein [Promicromonospora sp. AC04]PUB20828.1 hypothetical protein C8K30_11539 [Promicromonospora sp. AC04]